MSTTISNLRCCLAAASCFAAALTAQVYRGGEIPSRMEYNRARRVALVIGNSKYSENQLYNPEHDARDFGALLRNIGFDTDIEFDLDKAGMKAAVRRFIDKLSPGDVALFYYAGHGAAVDQENYLIPVDLSPRYQAEVKDGAYPASLVRDLMAERHARLKIVILDACRSTLPTGHRGPDAGFVGMSGGEGTFIAFAASEGKSAMDNPSGKNGLFTGELLREIRVPGLTIDEVFRRVREDVYTASHHEQVPGVYTEVLGDFYFIPEATPNAPPTPKMTPQAIDQRGDDFHLGRGVLKDDAEAVTWYRSSAERGYSRGQSDLATMYLWGWGVEKNYQEALKLFRSAAASGDARGENGLGIMCEDGLGIEKDYAKAVGWYRKAAEQGYGNAQSNLASMYRLGRGVTRDFVQAMRWYRQAADQDNPAGENGVGIMYCYGLGVPRDYAQALNWFREAAEKDDAFAESNLGYMYESGWGVVQNNEEALNWYRKSADQGNSNGQFSLGVMYVTGRGVAKSLRDGMKWLRLSAGQGNTLALGYIGAIYADGEDVPRDFKEAAKWFGKAAAQDDPVALEFFGEFYERGWGGTKDPAEAIRWYRRAVEFGSEDARKRLAHLGVR